MVASISIFTIAPLVVSPSYNGTYKIVIYLKYAQVLYMEVSVIGVIGRNAVPHVVEDNNQEQELVQILNLHLVEMPAVEIVRKHKAVMMQNVLVRLFYFLY